MICEYCKKTHNGSYGSGRFCDKSCANKFSSNKKTKDTYIQIGNKLKGKPCNNKGHKFKKSIYKIVCEKCNNVCEKEIADKYFNTNRYSKICNKCSGKFLTEDEIKKNKMMCGKNSAKTKLYKASILSFDESSLSEKYRRILKDQNGKCLICKIDSWNGKNLILQIHHIDGDKNNVKKENLQFLCPNCHSQTDNFNLKKSKKYRRISEDEFLYALKTTETIGEALSKLDLTNGNYERAYKLLNNVKN